jgi:hypothetical protein
MDFGASVPRFLGSVELHLIAGDQASQLRGIDSSTKAAHPEDTQAGYAEGVTLPLRMRPSTPVIGSGVTMGEPGYHRR